MPKRNPITDHYGTEIKVQPLMGSIGPCVDLERTPTTEEEFHNGGELAGLRIVETFDRLTPEQAVELGEWLVEAGEGKHG